MKKLVMERKVIKMIEKNSTYEERIMNALGQLQLSDEQLKICEEYLCGNKGKETLQEISFRDLSGADISSIHSIFGQLKGKKEMVLLDKLFQIMFAIGQVTIHNMLPYGMDTERIGISEDEVSKKAAIKSEIMCSVSVDYYAIHINELIHLVQKNPEEIKMALTYQKNPKGQVILLAVYFLIKYTNRTMPCIEMTKEDRELMGKYEELITTSFNNYDKKDVFQFAAGISYLNYPLSDKLKDVLGTCIRKNENDALWAINKVSMNTSMDIAGTYGNMEKEFEVSAEAVIRLLAEYGERRGGVLEELLQKNADSYLKVMDNCGILIKDFMYDLLKKNDEELYYRHVEQDIKNGLRKEKETRIDFVLDKPKHNLAVKAYLLGDITISELVKNDLTYSCLDARKRASIVNYCERYKDEELYRRCQVFAWISWSTRYLCESIMEENKIKADKVKELFRELDMENLDILHQAEGLEIVFDFEQVEKRETFVEVATEIFTEYLKERKEETIAAFSKADKAGKLVGLKVMGQEAAEYKQEILKYTKESNKIIQDELVALCSKHMEWEEEIKSLLTATKASEREIAVRIFIKWQDKGISCKELFEQALEEEKNAKVKKLLENALVMINEKAFDSGSMSKEDLVKELHKGNKKHNLEWAYSTPFSVVHKNNGEEASEEYLQAIFLSYDSMKTYGVSKNAELLVEDLKEEEFSIYVNELFDKWLETGAEAKKRWVLYVAAIHGGDDILQKLKHQIQEWPQEARGAIAAEAVQALALNPLPEALLFVDGLSRKFKNKQVKNAAGKALEFAASQLGLTTEELADKIVPDLGFDENMERTFDYGERTFRVTITPSLEIEAFDENGKKLKNLPAPGKKDDEVKAAEAYDEFKLMKKQMKTIISSQKQRLEIALSTEREWTVEAWKSLFVRNPIMHQFAIGLIWGIYEDRKLVQSFRYMEDGSFNTEDEEEYSLPESGKIGLVHPIELSEESKAAWKQQLEDYEIAQPIEQLDRQVFYITEEEAGQKSLERFRDKEISSLSLGGKLLGMGWYKGSVQDAGSFFTYYREDKDLELGVELHFSGSYVELGYADEEVTVYDARFYKAGTIARGSYMYEETTDENSYFLKDIPARYFSEIVLQLTKAIGATEK